jgi:hypothetical protein
VSGLERWESNEEGPGEPVIGTWPVSTSSWPGRSGWIATIPIHFKPLFLCTLSNNREYKSQRYIDVIITLKGKGLHSSTWEKYYLQMKTEIRLAWDLSPIELNVRGK